MKVLSFSTWRANKNVYNIKSGTQTQVILELQLYTRWYLLLEKWCAVWLYVYMYNTYL